MSSIWRSAHVRRWWLNQTEHNTNFGEILLHIFHKKASLLSKILYSIKSIVDKFSNSIMFDFWDRFGPDSIPWFRTSTKITMKVLHSPKWHCFSVQNSTHNLNTSPTKNPVYVYFSEPKSKKEMSKYVQAAIFTPGLHWESFLCGFYKFNWLWDLSNWTYCHNFWKSSSMVYWLKVGGASKLRLTWLLLEI
jgi:hypothetical protein